MNQLNELKARAYDLISAIEAMRHELQQVNETISNKTAEIVNANKEHER